MGTKAPAVEPPISSEYLTLTEAGPYSRHGKRTVQRWLSEGLLPFHRVAGGRRVLIRRADLDALLEAGRVEPRATKATRALGARQ
jgi:excisionase family DNA binding protein